jgi:hypothetical protein
MRPSPPLGLFSQAPVCLQALRLNAPEAGRAHGCPDPNADERVAAIQWLLSASEKDVVLALYPRPYRVLGLPPGETGEHLISTSRRPSENTCGLTECHVCSQGLWIWNACRARHQSI